MQNKYLLEVNDLSIGFKMYNQKLEQTVLDVVSEMSIAVAKGEIVAIAGSSGSGKSLLAHAILGILPDNALVSGEMHYLGQVLDKQRQALLRGKNIALIPQSVNYLDPLLTVGKQVCGVTGSRERQREIFAQYGLEQSVEKLYPYQLSGGMARRILLATALMNDAELIIADEPTPGLDLKIALEALQSFRQLANQGKGILLITHDIDLAFNIADKVAVFYAGTTVEITAASNFKNAAGGLRHPYSKALYKALPQNGFEPIAGFQPYAGDLPKGCLFGPRCEFFSKQCEHKIPMLKDEKGWVRCINELRN